MCVCVCVCVCVNDRHWLVYSLSLPFSCFLCPLSLSLYPHWENSALVKERGIEERREGGRREGDSQKETGEYETENREREHGWRTWGTQGAAPQGYCVCSYIWERLGDHQNTKKHTCLRHKYTSIEMFLYNIWNVFNCDHFFRLSGFRANQTPNAKPHSCMSASQ